MYLSWIQNWLGLASMISSLVGMIGLYVAISSNRRQLAVQIMLQYSEKFRAIMNSMPLEMIHPGLDREAAPITSTDLTRHAMQLFYALMEIHHLRENRYLPEKVWRLWFPDASLASDAALEERMGACQGAF